MERFARGPWWKKPAIVMRSPLSRTVHPANRFADEEERYVEAVSSASQADLPLPDLPDPYRKVSCPISFYFFSLFTFSIVLLPPVSSFCRWCFTAYLYRLFSRREKEAGKISVSTGTQYGS
jgi:hypothetical protein